MSKSLRQIAKEANALSSLWNNRDRYTPPSPELEAFSKERDWDAPKARIRLDVPYADKDRAKALGARWDAQLRTWYCYALTEEPKQWIPGTGEVAMLPAIDKPKRRDAGGRPYGKPKATPKKGFVIYVPPADETA
jgi:hypothetical protein